MTPSTTGVVTGPARAQAEARPIPSAARQYRAPERSLSDPGMDTPVASLERAARPGRIRRRALPRVLAVLLLLALPADTALALAITSSSLVISNLSIVPTAGVVSVDPWFAEASATANNSLGQIDGQFDFSDTLALAAAAVTFASGSSYGNALDAMAGAASGVTLPGALNQAASDGRGSLYTFFMILGGAGDVDVTFSMDVDGSQHFLTDALGSYRSELVATLEVDGDLVLFWQSLLTGGPGSPDTTTPLSTTLTATRTLTFGTPYFIFIQADSESSGLNAVPEPSVLALLAAGGLARAVVRRRRRNEVG
jgi:hypothetical protein